MLPLFFLYASLVTDVRELLAKHEYAAAEQSAKAYRSQKGVTPELAVAMSWMGRSALDAGQLDAADRYAGEARTMSRQLLQNHSLTADPWLPTAIGAGIEVHAQVLAKRGERGEAVQFLREQLVAYRAPSDLAERISKNLNLLNIEGKPAPALDLKEYLGPKPPGLAELRGHPVLLFFWAHWCGDCKGEVPIIASIMKTYGPKGLVLVGPTKYYGYVAGGEDAPPPVEKVYIDKVRRQFYAELPAMTVPLSNANFQVYGASSTPTIVLADAAGIVRYYHPGAAPEAELSSRIQRILGK